MATERTVISALAPCEQYGASAFVPAAKGIARFKMLDAKEFAECYFVGTFASAAFGHPRIVVYPGGARIEPAGSRRQGREPAARFVVRRG